MEKEPFVVVHKSTGDLFARLHDKQGNFFVYTVLDSCPKTYEAVLKQGVLIAKKVKGDVFRLSTGAKDPDYRLYNMIPVLEPVTVPPVHTFKDHVVYERETRQGTGYYVLHTAICSCGKEIPGTRSVSRDGSGSFSTIQAFRPNDKSARMKIGSIRQWLCPDCVVKDVPLDTPPQKPPVVVELTDLTPEQEALATVIDGMNWYKFQEFEGHFYKKGKPIIMDKKGKSGTLHFTTPCHKCKVPIALTAHVTFRDGKPYMVGTGKPDLNDAKAFMKGSSNWVHFECPEPEPKKESLKDALIKAAVNENPELGEEPAPPVPPAEEPAAPPAPPAPEGMPGTTALTLSLVKDLERISLDQQYNDDFVRGVTWAVLRMMKGGL